MKKTPRIQYRVVYDTELEHGAFANMLKTSYLSSKRKEAKQQKKAGSTPKVKKIIGRKTEKNPYGDYASPYYDPVKRHEYYEKHKDHVTRPYGTGASSIGGTLSSSGSLASSSGGAKKSSGGKGRVKKSSGGKGRAKKSSGGSKGRSRKAKAKRSRGRHATKKASTGRIEANLDALREQSANETEEQRQQTLKRVESLRKLLEEQERLLSNRKPDDEESVNVTEIRGKIADAKGQIQKEGRDLNEWISNEREALLKRIQAMKQ